MLQEFAAKAVPQLINASDLVLYTNFAFGYSLIAKSVLIAHTVSRKVAFWPAAPFC